MRDPQLKQDQRFWKTILAFFFLFSALQLLSGAVLFFAKVGWHPADIIEYYRGSEEMLRHFPERPDHFRRAGTLEGRLEITFIHTVAYAILVFVLSHLFRSAVRDDRRRILANRLGIVFATAAAADLLLDILILLLPWWVALLKFPAFLTFIASGTVLLVLCALDLKTH